MGRQAQAGVADRIPFLELAASYLAITAASCSSSRRVRCRCTSQVDGRTLADRACHLKMPAEYCAAVVQLSNNQGQE